MCVKEILADDDFCLALKKSGCVILSLYKSFERPLGWHRPVVRNFLEKTFKKHPAIAPIVQRMPEFFTSNHAPFFVLNKAY